METTLFTRKKLDPTIPVFTGIKHLETVSIQLFKYNADAYIEDVNISTKNFVAFPKDDNKYWLNIHGIHDVEVVTTICNKLGIHQLAVQDILDVNQRPKFQEYEDYWFFSLKSLLPSRDDEIATEQLSFILGDNYLISFQERKSDYFSHVRQRIRENVGIARERGSDFLLYLLFESILDNYFKTINTTEARLDSLNLSDIQKDPSPDALRTIELLKRQVNQIKRTIIPIKEFVVKVEREEIKFVVAKHIKYFYELKDICLSLMDDCDQLSASLESNVNLFFSVQGHRMNQIMKTLTVVTAVFIPLTFIAGIYGMNFSNMPELHWQWGYFGVWGIMIMVSIFMLFYFKKRKWF